MSTKHERQRRVQGFAICLKTDDSDLLTPRMIYRVLADASAAKSDYIRVVDNEGEDYLYPANYFVQVDLPLAVRRALSRTPVPVMPRAHAGRRV
jgi:hypothetical protein